MIKKLILIIIQCACKLLGALRSCHGESLRLFQIIQNGCPLAGSIPLCGISVFIPGLALLSFISLQLDFLGNC